MSADGSVTLSVNMDASDADRELARLKQKILRLEEDLAVKKNRKNVLVAQLEEAERKFHDLSELVKSGKTDVAPQLDPLAEEIQKIQSAVEKQNEALKNTQIELDGVMGRYGDVAQIAQSLADEKAMADARIQAAGLADKLMQTATSAQEAGADLEFAKEKAGDLAKNITNASVASDSLKLASDRVSKSFEKVGNRIAGLIKRVLFFSIITKALSGFRSWLEKIIVSNDEARAAIGRLKGALLTLAQPILNVVVPAFVTLLNIITSVITAIAKFVSRLFGTTLENSADQAKKLNEQKDAIAGVGGAAEKAEKQLAGFDEINQLSSTSASGGGSGGSSTEIAPNFDFAKITQGLDQIIDKVKTIGLIIGAWALSMKLLHGLELLTGLNIPKNIKIGIALMIAGVALAAENIANILNGKYKAASLDSLIREIVSGLMIGVGASLISGGAISAVWAVPVAIALVIGVTEIIVNWDKLKKMWSDVWEGIKAIFKGDTTTADQLFTDAVRTWMEGDSFMVEIVKKILGEDVWEAAKKYIDDGGTLAEAFGTVFSEIAEKIKAPFAGIAEWFDKNVISPVKKLVDPLSKSYEWFNTEVVGPIKNTFAPLKENIGKIFEGAWMIVEAIWKTVSEWFDKNVIQPIGGLFKVMKEDLAPAWQELCDAVKSIWETVSAWFSEHVTTPISNAWNTMLEDMQGFSKNIFNGVLAFFEKIVNGIVDGVNAVLSGFNGAASWAGRVLGKDWSGVGLLDHVTLPRLASGAVIPPNREFMAVLGDQRSGNNIEAPEALIRKIVREETGGSARLEALLQTLIEVTREGKVIQVNERELGRVTSRAQANAMRASGKVVLGY